MLNVIEMSAFAQRQPQVNRTLRTPQTALATRLETITAKAGVREKEIAAVAGTTPQTLHRWRNSKVVPQSDHLKRVLDLAYVATELSEMYRPEEARIWLYERHKLLGG